MFALQSSPKDTVAYKEQMGICLPKGKGGRAIEKVETLEKLHAARIIPKKVFRE